MGRILKLACLVLALVCCGESQDIPQEAEDIGNDDPCASILGVASPSDNLSCEFSSGDTECYFLSDLCNGINDCFTMSDEGNNIAALDCKSFDFI